MMPRRATSRSAASRRAAARRGLTLVELLLSLAITATIGVALATMMVSVSYGTTSKAQLRSAIVQLKAVTNRFDAALRGSAMVLDHGEDYLVLWIADSRADDAPNLSELRLIEYDAAAGRLTSHTADFGSLSDAQIEAVDTRYELTSDFRTVTTALKAGPYFPATRWADGVTLWQVALDDDDPQAATVASYRLAITSGPLTETNIGAVALRNR